MTMYLPKEYNRALLGYVRIPGSDNEHAVYDVDRIMLVLQTVHGMAGDEAEEWFQFNIEGAYLGPETPLYLIRKAT